MRPRPVVCVVLILAACPGGADATGTTGSTGATSTAPTSDGASPTAGETLAATTWGVFVPDLPPADDCDGRELGACMKGGAWCSGHEKVGEACEPATLGGPVDYRAPLVECLCIYPHAIRIVDLDGDGVDDVVVACGDDRVVTWFGGTGRPMACPEALAAASPRGLAIVDADLDGQLDLVAIDYVGELLSVLRGVGGRKFAPQYVIAVAGAAHADLDAADLDDDGDTDLVARGDTQTRVLLADGKGGFWAGQAIERPEACIHGALTDLDGDGRLDLPSFCQALGLSWRSGIGDANFAAEAPVLTSAANILGFEVADVDGDDRLDLLLATNDGPWLARGEGPLMFAEPAAIGPVIGVPGLRAADLDGEPPLELLLFGDDGDGFKGIWLLVGNGGGGYELAGKQPLYVKFSDLRVGDFSGDGQADIVTTGIITAVYNPAIHLLESAP